MRQGDSRGQGGNAACSTYQGRKDGDGLGDMADDDGVDVAVGVPVDEGDGEVEGSGGGNWVDPKLDVTKLGVADEAKRASVGSKPIGAGDTCVDVR